MLRTLLVVACATFGGALPMSYRHRAVKETLDEKLARTDSTLDRALAKIDELAIKVDELDGDAPHDGGFEHDARLGLPSAVDSDASRLDDEAADLEGWFTNKKKKREAELRNMEDSDLKQMLEAGWIVECFPRKM